MVEKDYLDIESAIDGADPRKLAKYFGFVIKPGYSSRRKPKDRDQGDYKKPIGRNPEETSHAN